MAEGIFNRVFNILEKMIGVSRIRHSYIVSNIANLETPRYKPKDVDFKQTLIGILQDQKDIDLRRTDPVHFKLSNSSVPIRLSEDKGKWNGYNWVNIDREISRLIENNLNYRIYVDTLLKKITLIKEVIKEGGR